LKEGREWFVRDTEFGKIGILICADLFSPEAVKTLSFMGAEAIFLPVSASRTHPSVEGYPLTIARAEESLVFILKAGNIISFSRGGRSAIIAPWGVIQEAKNGNEEEIVSADLDIFRLREYRQAHVSYK
jgi:predicted amidohydrolase